LTVAILGVCLVGVAQYQDRDSRGVPKTSATAPPPEDLLEKGVVTNEVYDRIKDYVIAHRDKQ
jgi:hypothetical protein